MNEILLYLFPYQNSECIHDQYCKKAAKIVTSHEIFIFKRPNPNELLSFSDSFINNETHSNEIFHIIKVASSIFLISDFRDDTGIYSKYMIANFRIDLRKFTKVRLAIEM